MVILKVALDWKRLNEIYEEQRRKRGLGNAGRKPHPRQLMGIIIVRSIRGCTLQEAADLVRHYGPARYLCDLTGSLSDWNPDFRTIWDFEQILGEEGLAQINVYCLEVAKNLGFADIRGLCSDTTAQEAQIPYPTEVGLMNSLAKSVEGAIVVLKEHAGQVGKKILSQVEKIKPLVRKHRLFCKTPEEKKEVGQRLLGLSQALIKRIRKFVPNISRSKLQGHEKRAFSRLQALGRVFGKLAPQMEYFFRTGKVAANKIVSLLQPEIRSIVRGKAGKKVEFGIKWGVNRIRGGYVHLYRMKNHLRADCEYMVEAVKQHFRVFKKAPRDLGYDRGGWSPPHLKKVERAGVKRIAVAPKGRARWLVSNRCRSRMVRERAQVEGVIGTLKSYGFNKPNAKKAPTMCQAGQRAALRFNLNKILRDAATAAKAQKVGATATR